MRHSTGVRSLCELIAHAAAVGLLTAEDPGAAVLAAAMPRAAAPSAGSIHDIGPGNQSRNGTPDGVRIGYAKISARARDHRAQLGALAAARCREIVVETASSQHIRPQLRRALDMLGEGDTLVICTPECVARSIKELLALLDDQLRVRGVNLHILAGTGAGLHRPDGDADSGTMLFAMAAMAAEMERALFRERTLDGLHAAQAQGRRPGRPAAVSDGVLAVARARRERGESVTAIARQLGIGRSTLYRALDLGRLTIGT